MNNSFEQYIISIKKNEESMKYSYDDFVLCLNKAFKRVSLEAEEKKSVKSPYAFFASVYVKPIFGTVFLSLIFLGGMSFVNKDAYEQKIGDTEILMSDLSSYADDMSFLEEDITNDSDFDELSDEVLVAKS